MTKLTFELTRPAKRFGGDRYEADIGDNKPWVLYIPQSGSRSGKGEIIADAFEITFEPK